MPLQTGLPASLVQSFFKAITNANASGVVGLVESQPALLQAPCPAGLLENVPTTAVSGNAEAKALLGGTCDNLRGVHAALLLLDAEVGALSSSSRRSSNENLPHAAAAPTAADDATLRTRRRIADTLLSHGAALERKNALTWGRRNTTLHLAAYLCDTTSVRALLTAGASPSFRNELGFAPVDVAADADDETRQLFKCPTSATAAPVGAVATPVGKVSAIRSAFVTPDMPGTCQPSATTARLAAASSAPVGPPVVRAAASSTPFVPTTSSVTGPLLHMLQSGPVGPPRGSESGRVKNSPFHQLDSSSRGGLVAPRPLRPAPVVKPLAFDVKGSAASAEAPIVKIDDSVAEEPAPVASAPVVDAPIIAAVADAPTPEVEVPITKAEMPIPKAVEHIPEAQAEAEPIKETQPQGATQALDNGLEEILKRYSAAELDAEIPEDESAEFQEQQAPASPTRRSADPWTSRWAQPLDDALETTVAVQPTLPAVTAAEIEYEPRIMKSSSSALLAQAKAVEAAEAAETPETQPQSAIAPPRPSLPPRETRIVVKTVSQEQMVIDRLHRLIDSSERAEAEQQPQRLVRRASIGGPRAMGSRSASVLDFPVDPPAAVQKPEQLRKMDSAYANSMENLAGLPALPPRAASSVNLVPNNSQPTGEMSGVAIVRLKSLLNIRLQPSKDGAAAYVYLAIRPASGPAHFTKAVTLAPGRPLDLGDAEFVLPVSAARGGSLAVELHCRLDAAAPANAQGHRSASRPSTLRSLFRPASAAPAATTSNAWGTAAATAAPRQRRSVQDVFRPADDGSSSDATAAPPQVDPSWPRVQSGLIGCLDATNPQELVGNSRPLTVTRRQVGLHSLVGGRAAIVAAAAAACQSGEQGLKHAPRPPTSGSSSSSARGLHKLFGSLRRASSRSRISLSGSNGNLAGSSGSATTQGAAAGEVAQLCFEVLFVPNPAGLPLEQLPGSIGAFQSWIERKDWHEHRWAEGFLSQRGADLKYWRRRHFRLVGHVLAGFREPEDAEPRCVFSLLAAAPGERVVVTDDFRNSEDEDLLDEVKIPFGFRLEWFSAANSRVPSQLVEFYASCDAEKQAWMARLQHVVNEAPRYVVPQWWSSLAA